MSAAALRPVGLPVLSGALPHEPVEGRGEVLDGGKAHAFGDLGDGEVGAGEQLGGGGHAGIRQLLGEGLSEAAPEHPLHLPGAQVQKVRQVLKGEVPVAVKEGVLQHGHQPRPGQRRGPHRLSDRLPVVHAHEGDDHLAKQRLGHLPHAGPGASALRDQLLQQRVHLSLVLPHPEVGVGEPEERVLGGVGAQLTVQVEAILGNGVCGVGALGVLNARAGDVEGVRLHAAGAAVDGHFTAAQAGIVDLVADVGVPMGGDHRRQLLDAHVNRRHLQAAHIEPVGEFVGLHAPSLHPRSIF